MKDKNKLYQKFLEHYPKDKLATMTLDEYTNLVPNESFCNWIEAKTEELGSIWGSTSFKFGIYRMKGQPKENSKFQHDDKYAWWSRYGAADAQSAFAIVRNSIVEIAKSASEHDLKAIDKIDILTGMFKWKIAYLYSDMWIIPIFNQDWLKTLCEHYGLAKASKASMAELQQYLIDRRGDTDANEYYESLLSTYFELRDSVSNKVWLYSPGENASYWQECQDKGIMAVGWDEMGDLRQYSSQENLKDCARAVYDSNDSWKNSGLCLWQFSNEIHVGDTVIVKNGRRKLIGRGVVTGDYQYDKLQGEYPNIRAVKWEIIGTWDAHYDLPLKTLTRFDVYPDELKKLNAIIDGKATAADFASPDNPQAINNAGKRYWWLLAKPKIFSFSEIALGGTQEWTLYNDNGAKRRVFQNYLDAKVGDVVFCYQATPTLQIVALAEVSRENDGETIEFKKVENLLTPIDYSEIKNNEALADMEFLKNPNGSFFKVTLEEAGELLEIIRAENPIRQEATKYTKENFLKEVYMSDSSYERLRTLLETKKNIILQGAPGVGKTFSAKRLAYSILEREDDSHVEIVQFHQNYSYEDFIMGYKPTDKGGFELKKGLFYTFCKKAAADDPKAKYYFIIDEINRGNLSKIFGELLMLIENDYRGKEIRLAYNGESFAVPDNVYLIGMMNTADRSLAMIDYALRRRFSFFEITPGFDSDGFKTLLKNTSNEKFNKLIDAVKALNEQIAKDNSLGRGFCIGHSYFCNPKGDIEQWLLNIVDYDIDPMLKEYWFDNEEKYKAEIAKLRSIF